MDFHKVNPLICTISYLRTCPMSHANRVLVLECAGERFTTLHEIIVNEGVTELCVEH